MHQTSFFKLDPARNPVLANLSEQATKNLLAMGNQFQLPRDSFLVHEGENSDSIFFLISGEVAILKGEREIDRQGSGGVLGEMGVLTNQPRTASVKCATDVEVLRVGAAEFLEVVDAHPDILRSFIRDLVGKMRGTHDVRLLQLDRIQKAKDTLSRAVSPEVLDRILDQRTPEELLEGSLNDAAILFFDIRGFSSAAERMPPRDLLRALNEHLAVIIECVAKHEGTIVNFIGDAVLAIFNCPVPLTAPATAALNCYLECRRKMNALLKKRKARNLICFELGAGINYGTVVSGAIGAQTRFSYSVLGDEVNLASRLESLTRHYPAEVILSECCYWQLAPELARRCIQIDYAQVKGRKRPVGLYTLTNLAEKPRRAFDEAFKLYLKGDFPAAADGFRKVTGPLAGYLAKRCDAFAAQKGLAWPGHYSWDVK